MVRKIFISIVLIAALTYGRTAHAQYTLTAYPPVGNNVALQDLWHFNISGTPNVNYVEYYIALRVFDQENDLIIKSNSSTFTIVVLPIYVNVANLSLVSPFTNTLYDNFYNDVVNNGGIFPPGNYHVVMTLLGRPLDGEFTELSQSEYDFSIEALYPPILIFPCGDTISTPNPTFTWTPAYINATTQNIQYCLRLVEMYAGQTSYQAITSNPSYFEQCNIPVTLLNYPPNANPLIPDQPYAWQVTATIDGIPAAYSNICEFVYHLPDTLHPPDSIFTYGILNPEIDGGFYFAAEEKLRFIFYYDSYTDGIGVPLKFNIYNPDNNQVIKTTGDNVLYGPTVVKYGENRYVFELNECGLNLVPGQYYILEIIDPKAFKYYLRFFSAESLTPNPCE